jgi:hypothetical protein
LPELKCLTEDESNFIRPLDFEVKNDPRPVLSQKITIDSDFDYKPKSVKKRAS